MNHFKFYINLKSDNFISMLLYPGCNNLQNILQTVSNPTTVHSSCILSWSQFNNKKNTKPNLILDFKVFFPWPVCIYLIQQV